MKLAANLSSLWLELPYLDRFEAAAAAGFQAVAVPLPYETPAKETHRASMRSALPVIQITAPPPNYTGGTRGFAAVPGLEERFKHDLRRAIRYCDALSVPFLHIMAGVVGGKEARKTLVANLRYALETVPESVTLTLQPQAQEGAFLNDFQLTADIIEEVGSVQLGLQFHSYHAQMIHRDAVAAFKSFASLVRHVQIADTPTLGAPGTGEIDFPALFDAIQTSQYKGWVAADYKSAGGTDGSLDWMSLAVH